MRSRQPASTRRGSPTSGPAGAPSSGTAFPSTSEGNGSYITSAATSTSDADANAASPLSGLLPAVLVSSKEKDAFNARLSDRRRQRRGQRLRRDRLHDSIVPPSAYRSKYFTACVMALGVAFGGWAVGFLWVATRMELNGSGEHGGGGSGGAPPGSGGVMSPIRLFERAAGEPRTNIFRNIQKALSRNSKNGEGGAEAESIELDPVAAAVANMKGNPNEVVDMRVLNQVLAFDNPNGGAWTQGWDVPPVPLDDPKRPLRIFVLPHSHCDPGWLKTFDDYFQSQTKQILTSVVQSLNKDPQRKFIWAEISYFEWWWREQSAATRGIVKRLLRDGQFEFVTGGWVQTDEANTQLYAMEIQLQEGHDFIRKELGDEYIPKFGWSIDPFGYSPTMAYLLKKYDFQGMLIQRVHYAIKKELALHKQLEFVWRQTWDTTGKHDIFTHLMPFYSYDVPHTCGPDPSVCCQFDFARMNDVAKYVDGCPWHKQPKKINDHNVEERALLLLDQYRKKAALYRSNVVMAPLGDDFRYRTVEEADAQYENYQRIFDYINQNVKNVHIQFGTLSDYFRTVLVDRPFSPPILKGSFFTYADRNEDYWSGYFTSRVFDKALDRQLERVLYAATGMGATKLELQGPRRALSLFQHHDGVTGTARTDVVEDYAKRIHSAIGETQTWMVQHLVTVESKAMSKALQVGPCWHSDAPRGLSENLCESQSNKREEHEVILYNPLDTEQSCGSVVVPGWTKAHATLPCELPGPAPGSKTAIQFDPSTGLMTHPIREEWMVWQVNQGGAYLFFPGTLTSYNELNLDIQDGGYVVSAKDWKRTVVERKTPDESGGSGSTVIDFIFETNLRNANEEWFARFTAEGLRNEGVFHTDLNGYNFDTHHFRSDMPIQSQVFPMPTHASIEDAKRRFTILSEHAQGTASLKEGSIDVWLDRRLNQDDNRGLGQPVLDNVPTRTRLRIVIETRGYDVKSPEFEITPFCKQQWKELNHPLEMFGRVSSSPKKLKSSSRLSLLQLDNSHIEKVRKRKARQKKHATEQAGVWDHKIPAVFLVYNRPDYLKKAIDSLRLSDYPRDEVPIIISHDGHVKEMMAYVESIKSEFHVIQLFHPHACSEHPSTFPGDDPKLNQDYKGDTYGNKREAKICCLKHHFTWMINEVFGLKETKDADAFLFLEEDYIVAPTVYETVQNGFNYIDESNRQNDFFGVTLDPTEGYGKVVPRAAAGKWIEKQFVTGPMAIRRDMFAKIKANARDYCTFDDYNWDWSVVHLMVKRALPYKVLVPSKLQAAHIGMEGGLHENSVGLAKIRAMKFHVKNLGPFHGKPDAPFTRYMSMRPANKRGFGGWGHPADHEHCLKLFGIKKSRW